MMTGGRKNKKINHRRNYSVVNIKKCIMNGLSQAVKEIIHRKGRQSFETG